MEHSVPCWQYMSAKDPQKRLPFGLTHKSVKVQWRKLKSSSCHHLAKEESLYFPMTGANHVLVCFVCGHKEMVNIMHAVAQTASRCKSLC